MSNDEHHRAALIETARSELDRAHRGVLAMDAGEVRRGLQLALTALREASDSPALSDAAAKIASALVELDEGALAHMDTLIEEVRSTLA